MSELPPYKYIRTLNTKTSEIKYFTPSFIQTRTFQASDYKVIDQIPNDPALVRPLPTTMGGKKEQKKESDDKMQDMIAQAVAAALASDRARIAELEAQLKAKPKKQKDNG